MDRQDRIFAAIMIPLLVGLVILADYVIRLHLASPDYAIHLQC